MSRLEAAAIALVRADEAYRQACSDYRKHVGRSDLDRLTPEEDAWWRANVIPPMDATWVAYLARVHPVFEAMIAAGIDREIANDAMVYLHARMSEGPVRR